MRDIARNTLDYSLRIAECGFEVWLHTRLYIQYSDFEYHSNLLWLERIVSPVAVQRILNLQLLRPCQHTHHEHTK